MRTKSSKSTEYQINYARNKYKELKSKGHVSYLVRDVPEVIAKVKAYVKQLRKK